MELLQLKYFLEVAESQHVTNSAKKLHVAQPALSQAIRRLEREFGVNLFEHTGRNIRLTPAGAYLKDRLAPALASIDGIARDIAAFSESERHTVRIDVQAASGIVVDAIALYSAEHPDTRFLISQNEHEPLCDIHVTALASDGSFHGLSASPPDAAVEATFTERIGIAVASRGPRPPEPTDLSGLAESRFICLAGSRAFRTLCDELCALAGFTPHIAFESDNPSVVKKMIGLGLGIGFWPEHSWGDLSDYEADLVSLADTRFARTIAIVDSDGEQSPEARRFEEFLIGHIGRIWEKESGQCA